MFHKISEKRIRKCINKPTLKFFDLMWLIFLAEIKIQKTKKLSFLEDNSINPRFLKMYKPICGSRDKKSS